MGRIFIDGFESGGSDLWDAVSGSVTSSTGLDMDGNYCFLMSTYSQYLEKIITATDEMYFAYLWRPTDTTNGLLTLLNGATVIMQFRRNTTTLEAFVGGSSVATGSATISTGVTYLIEVRFLMADSGGRIVIKVNGVTDIDYTGDTKPGTDTQFNKVKIGRHTWNGYCYVDNFIMDDAAWIGNTNIQAVVPTGAGNSTGWTPSAGANYECVDEKPYSDADYVSINAVDITDTYAAGNMVGSIESVKCVQVQSRALVDGSPTPTNLKLVVRSGVTDYLSGDKAVPVAAKSFSHLWENNPADSAAWAEVDVNAMEIGVKSAA